VPTNKQLCKTLTYAITDVIVAAHDGVLTGADYNSLACDLDRLATVLRQVRERLYPQPTRVPGGK
jgi:hypothetical protein